MFDSGGLFLQAAVDILLNVKKAAANARGLITKAKICDMQKINNLFNSLVTSIVNHGCPIWGPRHLEKIERLQNVFYKKLFLLPPTPLAMR